MSDMAEMDTDPLSALKAYIPDLNLDAGLAENVSWSGGNDFGCGQPRFVDSPLANFGQHSIDVVSCKHL